MARRTTGTRTLGNCDACIDPTPAVTVEEFSFSAGKVQLRLCDHDADRWQNDMLRWLRVGTILDERPQTLRSPTRRRPSQPSWRDTVVWSHVGVPEVVSTEVISEEPVEEDIPIREFRREFSPELSTSRLRRDELTEHSGWYFTVHAEERMDQADRPSLDEVLWCVAHPDTVIPSTSDDYPECVVHHRGRVRVVVDPNRKTVVTVMYREMFTEHEESQSA